MTKRVCFNCDEPMPPETEHFNIDNELYCAECVEVVPYTAYQYYLDGEFMGDSDGNGDIEFIESYDDDYEEE